MTPSPEGPTLASKQMTQTTTEGANRNTSVKVPPADVFRLEQLAQAHCRSMSGEVAWLIRQAHQQLIAEQEIN
jgi:hypothetical protein